MRRKKPLFLLEIVIAIFLVGLFSVYFLRSSIHCLYRERIALLDLEFERAFDIKRMDLLAKSWAAIEHVPATVTEFSEPWTIELGGKKYTREKKFKIWRTDPHPDYYQLILKEKGRKKHHFLVKKSAAFSKCSGISMP